MTLTAARWLAHFDADSVVFGRNASTGRLTPTGQTVSVGSPV